MHFRQLKTTLDSCCPQFLNTLTYTLLFFFGDFNGPNGSDFASPNTHRLAPRARLRTFNGDARASSVLIFPGPILTQTRPVWDCQSGLPVPDTSCMGKNSARSSDLFRSTGRMDAWSPCDRGPRCLLSIQRVLLDGVLHHL